MALKMSMSFYDGTLDREKAIEVIRQLDADTKILYTIGLSYRNPTTYKTPISAEKAIQILETESWVDFRVYSGYVDINTYTANDMW